MQDELNQIEVAPIDALKTLKDEQDVLEGRIASMDELKANVAEPVYFRVRADYSARLDALKAQARPLKEQARSQYGQLRALIGKLDADHEAIKLDRQEVELRHQLGEFDDAEFKRRIAAIEKQVAEKAGLREQAQTLRARFLGAVSAESELEGSSAAPASPNYSTSELPAVTPAAVAAAAAAAAAAGALTPPMGNPGSTMVMPAIRIPPSGDTVFMGAMKAPPASSDATVVFRPARLVPQNPEAGRTTFSISLKPMTIGTDTGNDIRLGGTGIEPKHAQIEPTPKGFVIKDLATKHGTRVNAEKISERALANEDVVQIGVARFVFRVG